MAFECVLMEDPVVAADGHTYNRFDIENWLKQHNTSPLTNEPLEHKILIPNIDKRRQINAWREEHGLPALTFGKPTKSQAPSSGVAAGGDGAQLSKPAAVCAFSKKPLQAFCTTCKKGICVHCLTDPARCKSHDTRPLEAIVCGIRDTHAAWAQVLEGRPQQLQAECDRVDAAGDAAHQAIREEVAELKLELQRACAGDLDGIIREQAQLLADVELAASSPDAAVAGSEASRCLLTAVARAPRPPPPGAGGGRFEAAAADGVRVRRLGRVVGGGARAVLRRAGGVSAAGAGFLRAFGSTGSGNGQFQHPCYCALDDEGNLVVSDYSNHRIQVLRYSDGAHLRTIGSQGSGNGQFSGPAAFAFDGAGHILVADNCNRRVQMLRYSDGAHVRTVGSQGGGNGQFNGPTSIACDGAGNFAVFDYGNARVQVFQLNDGAHLRSMGSKGSGNGQFGVSWVFLAFDADGNVVVSDQGNHRIQVLRYSDGTHLRTIGSQGSGNGQFSGPLGFAFDGAGHIIVADNCNHRVQMLRYSDGAHVRTVGSQGGGNGQFQNPRGVVVDGEGRFAVCEWTGSRVQVLE
jgi:DNA-binding beta-propeller fold protein YncE